MPDNICMLCGRIIPEGRHICLSCEGQNEMQTFRKKAEPAEKPMQYFRIKDDCGFIHYVTTDRLDLTAASIALLTPHVRSAKQISKEDYEAAIFREVHTL